MFHERRALLFLVACFGCLPLESLRCDEQPGESVCVLDFHRIGDDPGMDWLGRGLADMLMSGLNRVGPFQVVGRERLREILREHRLTGSTALDRGSAVRRARLAKAELLVVGSFAVRGKMILIEARLLRADSTAVEDNSPLLSQARWEGARAAVFDAPRVLWEGLLARDSARIDLSAGLEKAFPRTIDAAAAYYEGETLFDVGDYTAALARYLESVKRTDGFSAVHRAIIRTYRLLSLEDHALEFARKTGLQLAEAGDLPHAAECFFTVAQTLSGHFRKPRAALPWLERIVELGRPEETESDAEVEQTKKLVKSRALELARLPRYRGKKAASLLAHPDIASRIWHTSIERQLAERARLEAKGGFWVERDGSWRRDRLPDFSLWQWRTRALERLPSLQAGLGEMEPALVSYRRIHEDYAFLATAPIFPVGEGFYWSDGIRARALRVALDLADRDGRFPRAPPLLRWLRVHEVCAGKTFSRDFATLDVDARAHRRFPQGETFLFVAPTGGRLDAVTLEVRVGETAAFRLRSGSHKEERVFQPGTHRKTFRLPEGSELVVLHVSWRGIVMLNHAHVAPRGVTEGTPAIAWNATFGLAADRLVAPPPSRPSGDRKATSRGAKVIAQLRAREGWESGTFQARRAAEVIAGVRRKAEGIRWQAVEKSGQLEVTAVEDPASTRPLPWSIRSERGEWRPTLLSAVDGGHALLWSRGPRAAPDQFFVARSPDLTHWDEPTRLVLQGAGTSGPGARTDAVLAARQGYVMRLDNGYVRGSHDLIHWDAPRRLFPPVSDPVMTRTADGRIWAVYSDGAVDEQPYDRADEFIGFYVRGGRRWKRLFDIWATSSLDGREWQQPRKISTYGEPTKLWAFPLTDERLAVVALYNGRFLRWFASSTPESFRAVKGSVAQLGRRDVEFFVERRAVHSVRDVDGAASPPGAVLMRSAQLFESLVR